MEKPGFEVNPRRIQRTLFFLLKLWVRSPDGKESGKRIITINVYSYARKAAFCCVHFMYQNSGARIPGIQEQKKKLLTTL